MKPSKFISKLQYLPRQFVTCSPIQRVKAVKRLDASLWIVRLNIVIANVFNCHIFLKDVSVLIKSFIPWRLRKILYGHNSPSKMENVFIYFCMMLMNCKRILSQRVEREPKSLQLLHKCVYFIFNRHFLQHQRHQGTPRCWTQSWETRPQICPWWWSKDEDYVGDDIDDHNTLLGNRVRAFS